jgi:hypothetical protein
MKALFADRGMRAFFIVVLTPILHLFSRVRKIRNQCALKHSARKRLLKACAACSSRPRATVTAASRSATASHASSSIETQATNDPVLRPQSTSGRRTCTKAVLRKTRSVAVKGRVQEGRRQIRRRPSCLRLKRSPWGGDRVSSAKRHHEGRSVTGHGRVAL